MQRCRETRQLRRHAAQRASPVPIAVPAGSVWAPDWPLCVAGVGKGDWYPTCYYYAGNMGWALALGSEC